MNLRSDVTVEPHVVVAVTTSARSPLSLNFWNTSPGRGTSSTSGVASPSSPSPSDLVVRYLVDRSIDQSMGAGGGGATAGRGAGARVAAAAIWGNERVAGGRKRERERERERTRGHR